MKDDTKYDCRYFCRRISEITYPLDYPPLVVSYITVEFLFLIELMYVTIFEELTVMRNKNRFNNLVCCSYKNVFVSCHQVFKNGLKNRA